MPKVTEPRESCASQLFWSASRTTTPNGIDLRGSQDLLGPRPRHSSVLGHLLREEIELHAAPPREAVAKISSFREVASAELPAD